MPLSVSEAIHAFNEAQAVARGEDPPPEKFYPLPNRAALRAYRFGGAKVIVPGVDGKPQTYFQPQRSRIQRGRSRPGQRGVVLREGIKPIFVDEAGVVVDMDQFYEAAA